jgi:hypothetical protein
MRAVRLAAQAMEETVPLAESGPALRAIAG